MFRSATLKLTGWYLLILISISLIFSVAIYAITSNEVDERLMQLQTRFERSGYIIAPPGGESPDPRLVDLRTDQDERAKANLLIALFYSNLLILVGGGAGSYLLARRTLSGIEAVHEAQSRFTGDASHELRTPLTVMKTELEVALKDDTQTKSELRAVLQSSLEEVNKLSRLSQMLLQLSRADRGDIDMRAVDFAAVVQTVIKRLGQPKNRIQLTKAGNVPPAQGNADSLEELVMILLDNALKYSPDDSLVVVKLFAQSGKPCLEITNTGKGIAAEDLPRIFDRFYRADRSRTSSEASGYGLGLALAKQIVKLHHGDLSATSAVDHATTFSVVLPAKSQ